jgi:hypothetical protein
MNPDPPAVEPPRHPLPALATFELSRYRRDLEHALRCLPTTAPARQHVQQQLAEAMATTPRAPSDGHRPYP